MSDIYKVNERQTLSISACLSLGKEAFVARYKGLGSPAKIYKEMEALSKSKSKE